MKNKIAYLKTEKNTFQVTFENGNSLVIYTAKDKKLNKWEALGLLAEAQYAICNQIK